jgi:hypothetical protein
MEGACRSRRAKGWNIDSGGVEEQVVADLIKGRPSDPDPFAMSRMTRLVPSKNLMTNGGFQRRRQEADICSSPASTAAFVQR